MGAIQDSFRLDGKVALIAGVGPTSSRSFALAVAEAGADVCLVARSETHTLPIAEEVRVLGWWALTIRADLTESTQVDRMAARAKEELGRIDVLFNNVGGSAARSGLTTILDATDEDWDATFARNLDSIFYCTRAVGRIMVEQGWGGSIINTSSTAALSTPPRLTTYAVAKAGVNQFTRCMAKELAPHGVRVNCILLGTYENAADTLDLAEPGYADWWLKSVALGRLGKAGEAAAAGLYLASEASSYVTGTILPVTGGIAMFGN